MSKVYLLTYFNIEEDWTEYNIIGVYSSKELAEQKIESISPDSNGWGYTIEALELDK